MKIIKIIAVLYLCLVIAVAVFARTSSGEDMAPNGMTGMEILEHSGETTVNSFNFDLIGELSVMGTVGTGEMVGTVDVLNRELYIVSDSSTSYIVDGWVYYETATQDSSDWIKTALTDDIWQMLATPMQQLLLLEDPMDVEYAGSEQVGDVECYELDVHPGLESLWAAVVTGEVDPDIDLDEFFTEYVVQLWVDDESLLPVKLYYDVSMETEFYGETLNMSMSITMTMSDHNQTESIELPAAALEAEEVTYEEFIYG